MMLGAFTFLRPVWLLALLPLAAYGAWLWWRRGGIGGWDSGARPDLLAALTALGQVEPAPRRWPVLAALAAALLMVLALAGPAVERRSALAFRNLDGVVFVLDVSPSLVAAPAWVELQTMGRFALTALGTRPAALVVFAGDAYVATDLTADLRELGQTWSLLGPGVVPDPGTRPERGLALARKVLDDGAVLAGDVVLFTDGGGLGPQATAIAQAVAARGARLSVVLANAGQGAAAESLAKAGGGRAFGLDDTDALAGFLQRDGRDQLERQEYPLIYWRDFGPWLMALALLPLAALFRRPTP